MPVTAVGSVRIALSFGRPLSSSWPKVVHEIGSSSGSRPRSRQLGHLLEQLLGGRHPDVRPPASSTKRSWPPWVKVITTWVPFATASLAAARRSRPPSRRSMTSRSPVSSFRVSSSPRRSPPVTFAPSSRPTNCFFGSRGDRAAARDLDGLDPLADRPRDRARGGASRLRATQASLGPLTGFSEPRPLQTVRLRRRAASSASLAATCSACFFERPDARAPAAARRPPRPR